MNFERIETGDIYTSRRMKLPPDIRKWARDQIDIDTREIGHKPRLSDVYINLAKIGAADIDNVIFERSQNLIDVKGKGLVIKFPMGFYKVMEDDIKPGIKSGKYKKSTPGVVTIYNIFVSLVTHGKKLAEEQGKRTKSPVNGKHSNKHSADKQDIGAV